MRRAIRASVYSSATIAPVSTPTPPPPNAAAAAIRRAVLVRII
ncbi:hypothetical protein ACU686_31655 [Yinghuangia aomiensis]